MGKYLFLAVFALISMESLIDCADHEGKFPQIYYREDPSFQPNISLPLEGEKIDYMTRADDKTYPPRLSLAIVAAMAVTGFMISHGLQSVISLSSYVNKYSIDILAAGCAALVFVPLAHEMGKRSFNKICDVDYRLGRLIPAYNLAVEKEPSYDGKVLLNENGNRVFEIREHESNRVFGYQFDHWHRQHREATQGLVNKLLLGPDNLSRIRVIDEKLDAFSNQLRVPMNVKSARRAVKRALS